MCHIIDLGSSSVTHYESRSLGKRSVVCWPDGVLNLPDLARANNPGLSSPCGTANARSVHHDRRPTIEQSDGASPRTSRRVLISYAHDWDEPDHPRQVRQLWELLRSCGIDAKLDLPAATRRQDWSLWMADEIRAADVILVVASRAYRERAEGRAEPSVGQGVQWEARLIRDAFYRDQRALARFVPVLLPGQTIEGVPDFVAPHICSVYRVADFTVGGAESLIRLLTDQPGIVEPPLGPAPHLPPNDKTMTPTVAAPLERPGGSVHNEFTGNATGTVIQAGSIGSVTRDHPC